MNGCGARTQTAINFGIYSNINVSLESVVNVNYRVCVVFIMFPDHDVSIGNGYYYCYIIGTVPL